MERKLMWLYEHVSRLNPTLKELNEKWLESELNYKEEKKPLSRQTLFNWIHLLDDKYHISIKCRPGEYRYYVDSAPGDRMVQDWMMRTTAIKNMLAENMAIMDRIVLEDIPKISGSMEKISTAVRENSIVSFTYSDYWEDERKVTMKPYFMKIFRQRWHVVGPVIGKDGKDGEIESFDISADRMSELVILNETFIYPEDFSPDEFYHDNFSTLKDKDIKADRVVILAWEKQNFYIDSVPLHHSQKLIRRCEEDGYSIFEYWIEPTYDFIRELMSHGSYVEVLEPRWLRKEMIKEARAVIREYRGDSRKSCKLPIPEAPSKDK